MNTPAMSSGSGNLEAKRTLSNAARYVGAVAAAGLVVLALGLLWVHGCQSDGDDALANCGAVQRNFLAAGSPLIFFAGGVGAFIRTIQVWRARGRWWVWQGAGWFLLAAMLLMLMMTTPAALS